jgi:hypothetical protein
MVMGFSEAGQRPEQWAIPEMVVELEMAAWGELERRREALEVWSTLVSIWICLCILLLPAAPPEMELMLVVPEEGKYD